MDFQPNTLQQITSYIELLPEKKQLQLLSVLREETLVKKAQSLKVKKNDMTMKEISNIVNEVRAKKK